MWERLLRLLAKIPRLWKKRSSSSSNLWTGTITHEPWPLTKARLIAYGGICCKGGVLSALGLSELVQGGRPVLAHASSGVGPIDFFLSKEPPQPLLTGGELGAESGRGSCPRRRLGVLKVRNGRAAPR